MGHLAAGMAFDDFPHTQGMISGLVGCSVEGEMMDVFERIRNW